MKIRIDLILFIIGILVSNVIYFAYPPKHVWMKDGEYIDPNTHERLTDVDPDSLVHIGGVVNGDSYEVYRVMNPINMVPYVLMIISVLSYVVVQALVRLRGLQIPYIKL